MDFKQLFKYFQIERKPKNYDLDYYYSVYARNNKTNEYVPLDALYEEQLTFIQNCLENRADSGYLYYVYEYPHWFTDEYKDRLNKYVTEKGLLICFVNTDCVLISFKK